VKIADVEICEEILEFAIDVVELLEITQLVDKEEILRRFWNQVWSVMNPQTEHELLTKKRCLRKFCWMTKMTSRFGTSAEKLILKRFLSK
jgi:hypothetical protein